MGQSYIQILTKRKFFKGHKMKIKVYLPHGYKIVSVSVADDVKKIADNFERWEYVL